MALCSDNPCKNGNMNNAMDKTPDDKALHVDTSEFEMPQDGKLAKIAQALAQEDMISANRTETTYAVLAYVTSASYGIMF